MNILLGFGEIGAVDLDAGVPERGRQLDRLRHRRPEDVDLLDEEKPLLDNQSLLDHGNDGDAVLLTDSGGSIDLALDRYAPDLDVLAPNLVTNNDLLLFGDGADRDMLDVGRTFGNVRLLLDDR
ncbi:hypothetical protein J2Y58_003934 [Sphingomonas sp. BE138]|nr:hypothetical protein [Sphingomonas sp. BE138]